MESGYQTSFLTRQDIKRPILSSLSFLRAKLGANPSFGWWSLLEGKKILNKGHRWRVGDGKEIDIWKGPWIPQITNFNPRGGEVEGLHKVSQLIHEGQWNANLVRRLFDEEDTSRILAIPLSKFHVRDKMVWNHTKCGTYLTSSGYRSARDYKKDEGLRSKPVGESSTRDSEGELWSK
ncbi:hypothetical protein LIER_09934 [Lithospermum erythrorhizon]|uniref:Uncharacterized protein n=1 Tax=Lithospermum erythrorhizon TaxID=34254 RepID=A0AAV3PME9_LITER